MLCFSPGGSLARARSPTVVFMHSTPSAWIVCPPILARLVLIPFGPILMFLTQRDLPWLPYVKSHPPPQHSLLSLYAVFPVGLITFWCTTQCILYNVPLHLVSGLAPSRECSSVRLVLCSLHPQGLEQSSVGTQSIHVYHMNNSILLSWMLKLKSREVMHVSGSHGELAEVGLGPGQPPRSKFSAPSPDHEYCLCYNALDICAKESLKYRSCFHF